VCSPIYRPGHDPRAFPRLTKYVDCADILMGSFRFLQAIQFLSPLTNALFHFYKVLLESLRSQIGVDYAKEVMSYFLRVCWDRFGC